MRQIRCVAVPLETELLLRIHGCCGCVSSDGQWWDKDSFTTNCELIQLLESGSIFPGLWELTAAAQSYAFYEFCNERERDGEGNELVFWESNRWTEEEEEEGN